ncbi:MAG: SRPBCC family protein, partial [Thermomicrobiales bacterium]
MANVEKSIEVNQPVRTVYNQWTQFEEFPRFMEGIAEVRQLDDTRTHWRAAIAGFEVEWDAEITEQIPDQQVAWRTTSGPEHSGVITFVPVGDERTRVTVAIGYDPKN